ncbi:MAG TPA: CPBP family intramembrane glutamic endopeptidase [Candidatus Dormibacteraeota bacterium]|nr:CPBP family intramembrane glutamic endopeptidase [Candidatus Dormibacteraeota bacterium]
MSLNIASQWIAREREILRTLCVAELSGDERTRALASLAGYRFHDPHHRILFEVLRASPQSTPALLRERLPALLTRRGFPDFDVEFFLSTKQFPDRDLSPKELTAAIYRLAPRETSERSAKQMGSALRRRVALIEAVAFSFFIAAFIWQLQFTHRQSWIIFPVWLAVSFFLYRDTPTSLGWRADNVWPATRRAVIVFAVLSIAVSSIGFCLGWQHRVPVISFGHLWNYFAFCLLQEVALQSFLTNRLLMFFGGSSERWEAVLIAGAMFGAMHWPNPVLVPITFVGGTMMAWLFARERNIIPLAVGQAILGMLVWWAFPISWHHGMRVGPGFYTFGH